MKNKKKDQTEKNRIYYFILPLILSFVLALALVYLQQVKTEVISLQLPVNKETISVNPYPILNNNFDPLITSDGAIIMEQDSKKILFSKNHNVRFSTASTAKIVSAMVALDYYKNNDILTVSDKAVEGTVVGFFPGEKLYFDDVLYSMMIASGNDAAMVIAENYPGGTENFVKSMNQKVKQLGLTNTHFGDPAGLLDDQNYSTPYELARLSSFALNDTTLSRIVSTKNRVFTDITGSNYYEIENLNRLLGQSGVIGVKTGQTLGAGEVLATGRTEDGKTYIIVVMKSEDRFADTLNLINLINDNVSYIKPVIPE